MTEGASAPATAETKRVGVPFTDAELQRIDDWGFTNRIRNRSDVIRALVQRGLEAGAGD